MGTSPFDTHRRKLKVSRKLHESSSKGALTIMNVTFNEEQLHLKDN